MVPSTFTSISTSNATTGANNAFITAVSDDVTCSAASTRPVSASRTRYTVSLPASSWIPSTETMMPPFFLTCASHSPSSLASLEAREPRTVRLKHVQDLAARDRHSQRCQSLQQLLVHLIDRLVFPQ